MHMRLDHRWPCQFIMVEERKDYLIIKISMWGGGGLLITINYMVFLYYNYFIDNCLLKPYYYSLQ